LQEQACAGEFRKLAGVVVMGLDGRGGRFFLRLGEFQIVHGLLDHTRWQSPGTAAASTAPTLRPAQTVRAGKEPAVGTASTSRAASTTGAAPAAGAAPEQRLVARDLGGQLADF